MVVAAWLLACGAPESVAEPARPAPPTERPAAPPEPAPPAPTEVDAAVVDGVLTVATTLGPVVVTPLYHATTRIEAGGLTIWLDPWSKADLTKGPRADLVLVTDIHPDHADAAAIAAVVGPNAEVVGPAALALEGRKVDHVLANGESWTRGDLTVTAVPMYNLVRGPAEGQKFHDRGRGNGYLLTYGGRSILFAGDTECVPELKALKGVDVAFLPMNLPYTMPPEEAAACVDAFGPAVVIPYHYAGSDLAAFQAGITSKKTRVMSLEFYPGGPPW
jgi:L-ascorbate metabolism protein UlaG (beta-lactamase superfamily)